MIGRVVALGAALYYGRDVILDFVFNKIIINTQDNKLLKYGVYKYLRQHKPNSAIRVLDNGYEFLYTGYICCRAPFILFHIDKVQGDDNPFSKVEVITIYTLINTDDLIRYLRTMGADYSSKFIDVYTYDPCLPHKWEYMNRLYRGIRAPSDLDVLKYVDHLAMYPPTFRHSILLHGAPGTGKTTLIKYLATALNKDLYTIDASLFFGSSVVGDGGAPRTGNIPLYSCKECIIILEDIDRFFDVYVDRLDLGKILNFLDGVTTPSNIIFILTANNINSIPEVVRRDGRVNKIIEMKKKETNGRKDSSS